MNECEREREREREREGEREREIHAPTFKIINSTHYRFTQCFGGHASSQTFKRSATFRVARVLHRQNELIPAVKDRHMEMLKNHNQIDR